MNLKQTLFAAAALMAAASSPALADGAQNPLEIGRIAGSYVLHVMPTGYREYKLDRDGGWGKVENLEGQVGRAVYLAPQGHTSLEIFRGYEASLRAAGFKQTFELKSEKITTINSYFMERFFFGPETYGNDPGPEYRFAGSAQKPYYATFARTLNGRTELAAVVVGESGELEWKEGRRDVHIAKGQVIAALDVIDL